MDIVIDSWANLFRILAAMIIVTLEFYDFDTLTFWTDLLPYFRKHWGLDS